MTTRGGLFLKYVILFVIFVNGALVTCGLVEIYFSYQENKAALVPRPAREGADRRRSDRAIRPRYYRFVDFVLNSSRLATASRRRSGLPPWA